MEFAYQRLDISELPLWQPMPQLGNFHPQQSHQFLDLYGEGLPGILYQDAPGAWWYRAPLRDADGAGSDAVTYSELKPLPRIPSQQQNAALMDVNGDGRLDWVVTSAGVNGYHSMAPDGQWSGLIPVSALPVEYFHPRAQLADLTGAGLSDLVMIGPRSVRLYANRQTGWHVAETVIQTEGITLPIPGLDARNLVAFADMLGSGQQHLVEITASGVRCWPNLGHGRFGLPVALAGFTPCLLSGTCFDPDQVYLADMDGSGTTDIIYAHNTFLELFINESGNQFAAPVRIDLPDGIAFDLTCQLRIADIQGLGVSSIILSVPYQAMAHWRLDLTLSKPWLLHMMNNNRGAETTLCYRSSAQFWLDEKHSALTQARTAVSYLPFPVHVLSRTEVVDEITGNRLTSVQQYAHGAWDGQEREFRGFARVTQFDTDSTAQGTAKAPSETIASRSETWFATGVAEVDAQLSAEYWQGDAQAYPPFTSRFTLFDIDKQMDVAITPTADEAYWLQRALKGQVLHRELYGEDGSPESIVPYSVSDHRCQVRMMPALLNATVSVWVSEIENRSYQYERIANDPQCHQQVILASDAWGFPLDSVEVAYPRRSRPAQSPYPETLPDTLFESSYDEQQQSVCLMRQQQSWHQLTDCADGFILGLPDSSRSDSWDYPREALPVGGFSLEELIKENNLIAAGTSSTYLGHHRTVYVGSDERPSFPPLVAYHETAELDKLALTAFDDVLNDEELSVMLTAAGYMLIERPFNASAEPSVWGGRSGYATYGDNTTFYRVAEQRPTELTGTTGVTWDTHHCVAISTQDPVGLTVTADYDYRFMIPNHVIDANDNHQVTCFDALGRISSTRFWGTENGVMAGYTSDADFLIPESVDAALALTAGIPVAAFVFYNPLSWMPVMPPSLEKAGSFWLALYEAGVITEDNRLCQLAWRRWSACHGKTGVQIETGMRSPPHVLSVTTDRYDTDPAQQLRQTLTFSDGFGRVLQGAVRFEAGDAWQRAADGSLMTDEEGVLMVVYTENCWAVSGRTEYDGKGQPLRIYQPYFLDSWQYVNDDSAQQEMYADLHHYDSLGREYQVITAKGYIRRSLITPWFVVSEDENDTVVEA
ncbi:MAG: virulence protein [Burkholderiales bacterium]|nr:virulence protein [Burkholderiales bacterium]